MRYPDGAIVHVRDRVRLWEGAYGEVVCSLDTDEYSDRFPKSEWSYLERGILVESPQAGLIHYIEPEEGFDRFSHEDHA
jgi:hypothetical protein